MSSQSSSEKICLAYTVNIKGSAISFKCRSDQSVLGAQIEAGFAEITVGCRGGGCGVCRVQILSGAYVSGRMSQAQVSSADADAGIALACKVFPRENLYLRPAQKLCSQTPDAAGCDTLEAMPDPLA